MMRNFKMLLAYDGSRYRGWQRLGDSDRTIQGKLEACLTALLQQPVQVSGAGRTDAGTHAIGQAASFRAETALPAAQLLRQLRARLPEDIGVLDLQEAAPRFHARLNAVCKTYRYRVWVSDQPCVFDRKYVYVCPGAYDLAAMRQAAETLLGSHNFLAFSANRPGKKSTVRRLDALTIEKTGEELIFTLTGDGFLHHMVRILVGTLLEIGAGARPVSSIAEIFASGCRANAGVTVPAQGLCLMEVQYH